MADYYRNQYRSTPSRRVDGAVKMFHTRARKKRLAVLFSVLAFLALVIFGGLGALVWMIVGFVDGKDGQTGGTVAADDSVSAASTAALTDYELAPLVSLTDFRDASYVPIKAFHVNSDKATDKESMGRIMDIIDRTEINAMVVEVKDEYGRVAYDSDAPMAVEYGTVRPIIWGGDLDALLNTLTERNIVPIARIVCFKDSGFAEARPDLALMDTVTGQPWEDYKGNLYLNPYKQETWEYIVQVAEDAAQRGFREIQFDYIRFPDGLSGDLSTISYPDEYGEKVDAIAGFLAYARPRLEPLGVWVSADIFGWVLEDGSVKGIGQDIQKMAVNLDLVCPMVYPDHYDPGYGGIDDPAAYPYETIKRALRNATALLDGTGAKCRPYLEAHDAHGGRIEYTAALVEEEIRAAAELGFDEYLLWAGYPELGID